MSNPWSRFHDAGFDSLWYATGPGAYGEQWASRWFAGVWTGPDHDLICVVRNGTKKLAEEALSPSGYSPEEAVELTLAKRAPLLEACGRCQGVCEGVVTDAGEPSLCGLPTGHDPNCSLFIARDSPWSPDQFFGSGDPSGVYVDMTPEDKKDLRNIAILHAVGRMHELRLIEHHLRHAAQLAGGNTIGDRKLAERIRGIAVGASGYEDKFLQIVAGFNPEDYDYTRPTDYDELRIQEARERGIEISDEDIEDGYVCFEDPLELLKRLKESDDDVTD